MGRRTETVHCKEPQGIQLNQLSIYEERMGNSSSRVVMCRFLVLNSMVTNTQGAEFMFLVGQTISQTLKFQII